MPPKSKSVAELERDATSADDPKVAAELWREIVELEPTGDHCFELGWILLRDLGNAQAALAVFHRGVEVEPSHAQCIAMIGDALGALGQREEAIAMYDHALQIDPTQLRSLLNKACELNTLGRHREALAPLGIAREHHKEADVPYQLACTHACLREADAALEWLAIAVTSEPLWGPTAAKEEELEWLRADPRFAKIVGPSP